MIVSGYNLDLYCDAPGCTHGEYGKRPAKSEYADESPFVCRTQAKKDGWKLDLNERTAVCPECAKKGQRPPKSPEIDGEVDGN